MNTEDTQPSVTVNIYHDTRRAKKKSNRFPVKLRVSDKKTQKTKLYKTKLDLSEKEFHAIWEATRKTPDNKEIYLQLRELEQTADNILLSLPRFSFPEFEKLLYNVKEPVPDIFEAYDKKISDLIGNDQISTSKIYSDAKRSLSTFHSTPESSLLFSEITTEWLERYEKFEKQNNVSVNTISIRLRTLRTLFNQAISLGVVTQEMYPFGKNAYQIPAATKVKKALTHNELGILHKTEAKTLEQQTAKDFWFFSYINYGINLKDIAELKWKNLDNDKLHFYRAKTLRKTKTNQTPVIIPLSPYSLSIIEKYGNKDKNSDSYIFPILSKKDTELDKHTKIKNFNRSLKQGIEKHAKNCGLDYKISMYWARHSFATNAIRKGASMELISQALSHNSLKTTYTYFAGFESEVLKDLSTDLMDF